MIHGEVTECDEFSFNVAMLSFFLRELQGIAKLILLPCDSTCICLILIHILCDSRLDGSISQRLILFPPPRTSPNGYGNVHPWADVRHRHGTTTGSVERTTIGGRESMRLIVIGQAPFGRDCLQALLDRGEQVVGTITIPDVPGAKKPNPFKELAMERGLPLLQPRTLKGPEVLDWVRDKKPDLFVLVFVTQYMGKDVIEAASHGGINYHPSLLPKYRGGSAIAWAILHGELQTGVTIHYIDDGVDTGDIVLQEAVPIGPEDTTTTLYFNKLYPLGVKLVPEAVRLIREGKAPRIPQDPRLASFQPALKREHTGIDWRQTSGSIFNLIRGAFPVPGAETRWQGKNLTILEAASMPSETWERPTAAPGEILDLGDDGFTVQTGLGVLKVKKVQTKEAGKLGASDFARSCGLKAGDVLESIVPAATPSGA